jgi:hypothetical protein
MKTFLALLISMLLGFSSYAESGWELYDNFEQGTIDNQKWIKDESCGTISVENGKAKFAHAPGHPNDSLYLIFSKNTANISGIKATITVASCTGDVRTRIAGYSGMIDENYLWTGIQFEPLTSRIYNSIAVEGPPPTYEGLYQLHYSEYRNPIQIVGQTFESQILFSNDGVSFEANSFGKLTYKFADEVSATDYFFRAIGTRSTEGQGPCVVYFDNVYVYVP